MAGKSTSVVDGCGIDPGAWDFLAPPVIRFGAGRVSELPEVVAPLGFRVWLVGGRRSLVSGPAGRRIVDGLESAGFAPEVVAVTAGEPTVDDLAAALATLPGGDRAGVVVVAVGGGSAIDLAKALAALATNLPEGLDAPRYDPLIVDRLEGVGRGIPIDVAPLPMIAVPTTAGTGAEATRNAVISCPRRRFKKSLRSPLMVPRAAIVDPDLTAGCDRATVAAAGLDCITQLIESFICRIRRPLPRALVLDALPRAVRALPRVLDDPSDAAARGAMSHAALVSGVALSNSGLGLAHGVAAALGVECGTPHGLACGLLLPVALAVNADVAAADYALLERAIDSAAATDDTSAAAAFVARIDAICNVAGLPRRFSEVGLRRDRIGWLAENSGGASLRGNPVELDPQTLLEILAPIW
jgi:alcohol dehydrogenase class IV